MTQRGTFDTFRFTRVGEYTVTLTVKNQYGSNSKTQWVRVQELDIPSAENNLPRINTGDLEVIRDDTATNTDSRFSRSSGDIQKIEYPSCPGDCECLLESEAIQKFGDTTHVPVLYSSTVCGTSGGVNKYCYLQGLGQCSYGMECLEEAMAYRTFVQPKRYSTSVCAYATSTVGAKIP